MQGAIGADEGAISFEAEVVVGQQGDELAVATMPRQRLHDDRT